MTSSTPSAALVATATAERLAQAATVAQQRAADPESSVWVGASAGTGKTKVLTDRVLRLLMEGVRPTKILALTFTKTAAAEMANRVTQRLSHWAAADDDGLEADLFKLLGARPTSAQTTRARRLFADVLEAPGGMRIQTIHSFCQSLLARFPFEAGIAANFELLDEQQAEGLLKNTRDIYLQKARVSHDPERRQWLDTLAGHGDETSIIELIQTLLKEQTRIQEMLDHHGGLMGWDGHLRALLGLSPDDQLETLMALAVDEISFDRQTLLHVVQTAERTGAKTDTKLAQVVSLWLQSSPQERLQQFDVYCSVFLTADYGIRKSHVTKAVINALPQASECLTIEAKRLLSVIKKRNALQVVEANGALLGLAQGIFQAYGRAKAARTLLDFDDLILKSRYLLEKDQSATAWVLFKLDEGLSHILVDEAQDTNPDQWRIVARLAEEFFTGKGQSQEEPRTLFVVGDRKQSIYSFQRADPDAFEDMRQHFEARVHQAQQQWQHIPLSISFRSTQAVLDVTDAVFAGMDQPTPGLLGMDETWQKHQAWRAQSPGRVTLWPLLEAEEDENSEQLALRQAQQLTETIQDWLYRLPDDHPDAHLLRYQNGRWQRRRVQPGDIMVLVQRRATLAQALNTALKRADIPVAGMDRIRLLEQLVVQDLIAVGDFALMPDDDLTLACVLRGPLIGISEEQLFELAYDRGPRTLWSSLRDKARSEPSVWGEMTKRLQAWLRMADFTPAFEFYATVLNRFEGRQRLLGRLGLETEESIDEFLNLCFQYEREAPSSLQGFLHWVKASSLEIKRDFEQGANEIRIMTVHAAKGLQAPIVLLPDTTGRDSRTSSLLWDRREDITQGIPHCVWVPKTRLDSAYTSNLRAFLQERDLEERQRLLYVALTRAEDRLYIGGNLPNRTKLKESSWYASVERGISGMPGVQTTLAGMMVQSGIRPENPTAIPFESGPLPSALLPRLPAYVYNPPPPEEPTKAPLMPSKMEEPEPAAHGPGKSNLPGFRRGLIIHSLLEYLPQTEPSSWEARARRFLKQQYPPLEPDIQEELWQETTRVLHDPRVEGLFGPESKAEPAITGKINDQVISGRIDRLIVKEDSVLVIDYKTNRVLPETIAETPKIYRKQMQAYRMLLERIYPTKSIHTFLLWTNIPRLDEIR